MAQNRDTEEGRERDDLADRLIEKRERLHYFVVTGATAVIAFTITSLRDAIDDLGTCTRVALISGGVLLLAAAGLALYTIFERHRVYAQYLDELSGRVQRMPEADQLSVRRKFGRLQGWMMALFYVGVVVLSIVNTIALF